MIRIAGILCGSAVAISLLIIAVGVPKFLPGTDAIAELAADPPPVAELVEAVEAVEVISIDEETSDSEPTRETVVERIVAATEEPASETPPLPRSTTENWYAFWSPFRSELAANGFVAQLQRTTGMDYRVVRLKPGVYEVAFAYEGERDIAPKLATISAATGLEMPDG